MRVTIFSTGSKFHLFLKLHTLTQVVLFYALLLVHDEPLLLHLVAICVCFMPLASLVPRPPFGGGLGTRLASSILNCKNVVASIAIIIDSRM